MGNTLERNRRFTRCALRISSIPGLSFLPFPHQWFPIPSGFSVRLVKYLKDFWQWIGVVKVVSRGTPRSRTSVAWGIRWVVSAVEKGGESGVRFPTVRHLLGLIGVQFFSVLQMSTSCGAQIAWVVIKSTFPVFRLSNGWATWRHYREKLTPGLAKMFTI